MDDQPIELEPLHTLHADAPYLVGRVVVGTMEADEVVAVIRSRIDVALEILAAHPPRAQAACDSKTPDGWRLVPVKPTLTMLDSADDAIRDFPRPISRYETPLAPKIAYWMAMIAAAPEPPKPAQCTCPSGDGSLRWPCPVHPPGEIDQTAFQRMTERGREAWKDVPNATAWVDELRGNQAD